MTTNERTAMYEPEYAAKQDRASGDVSREVEKLGVSVEQLHKLVAVLRERLSSVCRSEPSEAVKEIGDHPRPMLVPLAEQLYGANEQLGAALRGLDDLSNAISV